jgi:integrase
VFLSEFALRQFRELRTLTGWSAWVMPSARKRAPGKEAPQPEVDAPIGKQALTKQFTDRQSPLNKKHRTQAKGTLTLDGGRWTAHDLRRTGATIMGENGVMSEVIERCLNHKEHRKVVRTYQRQELLPERREAWRVLGDALDAAFNDTPRAVVPLTTAARERTATIHYPQWGVTRSVRHRTSSS